MRTSNELKQLLMKIDRRGYPGYKEIRGQYSFQGYVLSVDHVQGDPFAAPSDLSVRVSGKRALFPKEIYEKGHLRIAVQDHLTRLFWKKAQEYTFKVGGSGHSGLISTSRCGQEVLERTACRIEPDSGDVTMRFHMGFPANGRTINAGALERMLFDFLPECVESSLIYANLDTAALMRQVKLAEDQQYIREALPKLGLCAFVADGSVLPRESGVSQKPMKGAVPFVSPEELAVTLQLPNAGSTRGMGVKKGVTLIVGGGYHGKSTLLKALELGVYNHVAGDGREYVITEDSAVKIRAEDGRSVVCTDISMFINNLPNGKDTTRFSTQDASGSTSQAANVVEAIESGASTLLIDEDTSATNFMVRDLLMQRVISRDMEPITPFIDRVRQIFDNFGMSTIIVAGSSGAYFNVADSVIQMDKYLPKDITDTAKKEAAAFQRPFGSAVPISKPCFDRRPRASAEFRQGERIKLKSLGRDGVAVNRETVELRYVEQLADGEQSTALGFCIVYAQRRLFDGKKDLRRIVDQLETLMGDSLEKLTDGFRAEPVARPRRQEIFACFNRYRNLNLR